MLTHSLLPFVDCPDGLTQDTSISNSASIPEPGCTTTPHTTSSEQTVLPSGGNALLSYMFCGKTLPHQDDLVSHILAEHPTTAPEPSVTKIEAEFKMPREMPGEMPSLPVEKEELLRCILCGHVSRDTGELKSHVRKHEEYYTYFCKICGRRFKEAWYLKNHMKKHSTEREMGKGQQEVEPPVTVNGVPQEPSEPAFSPYEMCSACGFFFPDQESLDKHSKVHNRQVEPDKEEERKNPQEIFLGHLSLKPFSSKSGSPERKSTWIPQLKPVDTHQAWKLATTGKPVVAVKNPKVHSARKEKDSASDKAKIKGQGGQPLKEVAGKERRPQKPAAQMHRTPPIPKVKDMPTTCEVRVKTFKTHKQLVFHSREHKQEQNGEKVPVSPVKVKQPKAVPPRQGEDSRKEAAEETLASDEEKPDRSKHKSKECNHCGKSFNSSYHLKVHLRTHTGEKPYKCVYCDYAAAQKTSLNCHLQRHHKDQPLNQHKDQVLDQPLNQHKVQPLNQHKDQVLDQPLNQHKVQPLNQHKDQVLDQPLNQHKVQPLNQHKDQPLNQHKVQPLDQHKDQVLDQPLNQHKGQVLNQHKDQPLNQHKGQVLNQHKGQVLNQHKDQVLDQHKDQVLDQHKHQVLDQPLDLPVRSSTKRKLENDEENPEPKRRRPTGGSPDGRINSVWGKFDNPPVFEKTEYNALPPTDNGHLRHSSPPHLEKVDIKSEISDEPLNLSLTNSASTESKLDVFPFSCPHCHNTSIIERKVIHIHKPDTERNRFGGNTKRERSTSCPPALDGKDRSPSPSPPPAKRQKPSVSPANGLRQNPAPVQDGAQQSARECKYEMDRMAPAHMKPGVIATPMDGPNRLPMTGTSVRTTPEGTGLPPPSEVLGACPPLTASLDSEWVIMNLLGPDTPDDLAAGHPADPNLQRREPAVTFPCSPL